MSNLTDQLIDRFAEKLRASGAQVQRQDNTAHLHEFEAKLPRRLPPSFASLLSRYSFAAFDAGGVTFFGWGPDCAEFSEVAPPARGSLSELLLPAGFVQIGRPDTGSFDAVCFELSSKQNREYRIVQADHEEILCNFRLKIRGELWPSFRKLAEHWLTLQ